MTFLFGATFSNALTVPLSVLKCVFRVFGRQSVVLGIKTGLIFAQFINFFSFSFTNTLYILDTYPSYMSSEQYFLPVLEMSFYSIVSSAMHKYLYLR